MKSQILTLFDSFFFYPPLETWQPVQPYAYTQKSCDEIFFFLHLETCHLFIVQKNKKKEFRKYGKKVKFCLAKLVRNTSTVCFHCLQLSMPENKNFTYSNVALLRRRQKNKYEILKIELFSLVYVPFDKKTWLQNELKNRSI